MRLNELGYQARWEARPGDPQVQFGHCPYTAIIADHPELCLLDAALLESMLGNSAIQTAKLETDFQGGKYCRFVIGRET
jgi:predicted ArsR family transcriptional regulator